MSRIAIFMFSGTGNTKLVAEQYKKNFEKHNDETQIFNIESTNINAVDLSSFKKIGFAYPIHAFNAPQIVVDFAKSLPILKNPKYTFIFKTSGEPLKLNDASSQKLIKILQKKNFDVAFERHIVMPYNMIFRHNDIIAKQMWINAKGLVEIYSKLVLRAHREIVTQPLYKKLHTPLLRVEWPAAKLNGKLYKVDQNKCIHCGKCIESCPTNNIFEKDGKIKFGNNCIMCVRCSFNCPTNAINIGMLNGWKVNGSYKLEKLENDETVPDEFINEETKGLWKIYKNYFVNAKNSVNKYVKKDKK